MGSFLKCAMTCDIQAHDRYVISTTLEVESRQSWHTCPKGCGVNPTLCCQIPNRSPGDIKLSNT